MYAARRTRRWSILTGLFDEEGGAASASLIGAADAHQPAECRAGQRLPGTPGGLRRHPLPRRSSTPRPPPSPPPFAVAEREGATGLDVLAATVLGVEACCRVGLSVYPNHYDAGWHITGTCGVFGAAGAAAGGLLGLDETSDDVRPRHCGDAGRGRARGLRVHVQAFPRGPRRAERRARRAAGPPRLHLHPRDPRGPTGFRRRPLHRVRHGANLRRAR